MGLGVRGLPTEEWLSPRSPPAFSTFPLDAGFLSSPRGPSSIVALVGEGTGFLVPLRTEWGSQVCLGVGDMGQPNWVLGGGEDIAPGSPPPDTHREAVHPSTLVHVTAAPNTAVHGPREGHRHLQLR